MAKSTTPMAVLAPLEKKVKLHRFGLVALAVASNLSMWLLFYLVSQWLGSTLTSNEKITLPTAYFFVISLTFMILSMLGIHLRRVAGLVFQRQFYQQFFAHLHHHRWALIRSKPITAWQDVSFRHLPALESYALDYRPQLMLINFVPLLVLLLVFPISWLSGLILFFTLPLMPLFMWLVGSGTANVQKKHMLTLNRLGLFFADRIRGASTVRLLNQQSEQLETFQQVSKIHNERLAEVLRLAFLNSSVLDFFATVSIALQAVFIGFALLGEINIGFYQSGPTLAKGLFILLLSPAFFAELKKLGKLYHVKAEATASAELWQDTLAYRQPINWQEQANPTTFQNLTLSNAEILGFDHKPLLTIASCHLKAGERIQITGESGSGKSVVLDALAGLREIKANEILMNSTAIKNLGLIRDQVFYLGQSPIFFDGTVRENIGLNQFTDNEIRNAVNTVGMSSWFKTLNNGLDSCLEEQTNLSGGQKQKLALARLVLFDFPLILLDEPLAHLSHSEQTELLTLLTQLTNSRCSVWVSHIPLPTELFTKTWQLENQSLREIKQ